MTFVMHFLSHLRGKIPIFCSLGGALLGLLAVRSLGLGLESIHPAWITGGIVGFILGFVVKRLVPDPEERGL